MKVKCTSLFDASGSAVEYLPWLKLEKIYHVLSIFIDNNGSRSYSVISSHPEGEWPQVSSHQAKCFEIVSEVVPSNWNVWIHGSGAIGISPRAWQAVEFWSDFFDHVPYTYDIYIRERNTIFEEDP